MLSYVRTWLVLSLVVSVMGTNYILGGPDWVQTPSPAGGMMWNRYDALDPVLPVPLTETHFQVTSILDGFFLPDTMNFLQWNTYPRQGGSSPTDVRITLLCAYAGSEDMDVVSVVGHSVPNSGSWMWIVRVPRSWSPDDMYALQICSLDDDHECSRSPMFRILNPYAFYP